MTSRWPVPLVDDDWTPATGVHAAAAALGRQTLIDWCIDVLTGSALGVDPATPSLRWIGGAAAGTDEHRDYWAGPKVAYWPRVWAARALRYVWESDAEHAVLAGLRDEAWRVRERCCALAGTHEIADAAGRLAELTSEVDQTLRVRLAAITALAEVAEFEQADAISRAVTDPVPAMRQAAEQSLRRLSERLDRRLD
ncbi:MAG: HEAT repeat domain-containing protein [Nakamurella sp.]